MDSVVDICLKCNVWPRIDRCRDQLIIRGDEQSYSQCLFNLLNGDVVRVHRYSYRITSERDRDSPMVLNRYVSMKIDRAITLQQDTVR